MLKKIRERIVQSRRVVIKVGTNVLAEKDGTLSVDRVKSLVGDICRARDEWKKEIILVTSGAIGAGMAELKVAERPKAMPELQALASVGQCRLIQAYHDFFRKKGVTIGQVLLTLDDLTNRKRHLNTSNTLMTLLRKGVLPVINENDTVAVDEIRFGDNDILSAMVSILIRADLLIILSTVDGFYDTENNILFEYVCSISEDVKKHIRADKSALGVGGMDTKVRAAQKILAVGEIAVIANGTKKGALERILSGQKEGTVFFSDKARMTGKKRWLAFFPTPEGKIVIDRGAVRALSEKNRSLLPAGIRSVEGDFAEGSVISIISEENGDEIGRGLTNYASSDITRIAGHQSRDIKGIIGICEYDEVVHRDNLVILKAGGKEKA